MAPQQPVQQPVQPPVQQQFQQPMQPEKKKKSKKAIIFIVIGIIVVLIIISQFGGKDKKNSKDSGTTTTAAALVAETQPQTKAPVTVPGEGIVDGNKVKIVSAKVSKDYDKKPCLVVTYTWTNGGDEAQAFIYAFNHTAYQNGIELDTAIMLDDNFDSSAAINKIKPGIEQTVQCAYSLSDTTSPVEIEVNELFALGDPAPVTMTFELK